MVCPVDFQIYLLSQQLCRWYDEIVHLSRGFLSKNIQANTSNSHKKVKHLEPVTFLDKKRFSSYARSVCILSSAEIRSIYGFLFFSSYRHMVRHGGQSGCTHKPFNEESCGLSMTSYENGHQFHTRSYNEQCVAGSCF